MSSETQEQPGNKKGALVGAKGLRREPKPQKRVNKGLLFVLVFMFSNHTRLRGLGFRV